MKNALYPRFTGGFLSRAGLYLLGILLVFGISRCAEPDEIGLDLIQDRATVGSTDTLSIRAFTSLADSVPTNFSFQNTLGVINDPVFGKLKAGIFTEFRLPRNDFSLGENPAFDSIVLSFGYSGTYYGQLEAFQQLKVYELSESFPQKDTLYSNLYITHFEDPIGARLLRPAPKDSVVIDTLMFAPHFSVRLSDAFGQKFIDANGTTAYQNVNNFLDYFKGLYIAVDDEVQGLGSIYNLNMFSSFTRLSLYYRENGETARRNDFFISEFARRSSYFENRDFQGGNDFLLEQLVSPNAESLGDSLLFVQGMGKLRANVHIPHLNQLSILPNVTINQARLIAPVADGFSDENFPEASQLRLYQFNEDGSTSIISDIMLGDDYFGGTFDSVKKQYQFNITQYIQQVIDGKITNNGIAIVVGGGAENAARVVLHGPGRTNKPMKLEIIYTVFD